MRVLIPSFFCACALWQSAPAFAQSSPPVLSEGATSQATQLSQSAELAYKAGDFSSALEDYSLSYSLSQDPQLFFFIAQCHQKLGNYADAIQNYQNFLLKTTTPLNNEQRQEVESLILEAQELEKQQRKPDPQIESAETNPERKESSLFWAKKPSRTYTPYFAASGFALLAATVSATLSIQTANNVEAMSSSELISEDDLNRGRSMSLLLAVGADVLVLTSAITGTVGVVKWHDQKRELSAKASANSLWLQLRY
jgi:tetratricopeptide (TPR) repeat protein